MTPEERAEDVLRGISQAGASILSWHAREVVAAAIRAGENDALERAAVALGEDFSWVLPLYESVEVNQATDDAACSVQKQAAAYLRALKHKDGTP